MNPQAILDAVEAQSTWMHTTLRALVEQESPSEDRQSVNAAVTLVEELACSLGFSAKRHQHKDFGDVLELSLTPHSRQKPVLLLGHLDTVWALGTLKTMPWREEKGRYWGPGVLDMKAGVTMALAAVSVLRKLKQERNVTLLLNSDEEIGSTFSRPITERLAKKSEAVFVLEPAQGLAYKTSRKGVGYYDVEVAGVAAHSGVDFERGHSAVLELARQIQNRRCA